MVCSRLLQWKQAPRLKDPEGNALLRPGLLDREKRRRETSGVEGVACTRSCVESRLEALSPLPSRRRETLSLDRLALLLSLLPSFCCCTPPSGVTCGRGRVLPEKTVRGNTAPSVSPEGLLKTLRGTGACKSPSERDRSSSDSPHGGRCCFCCRKDAKRVASLPSARNISPGAHLARASGLEHFARISCGRHHQRVHARHESAAGVSA